MNSIRFFLVDDDPIFTLITQKVLWRVAPGAKSKDFEDGQKAIDYLKEIVNDEEKLPHAIILDINMPVMDGWSFLAEYLMLEPLLSREILLYVVSSSISPVDIERVQGIKQVRKFLSKPLDREKITEITEDVSLMFYRQPTN